MLDFSSEASLGRELHFTSPTGHDTGPGCGSAPGPRGRYMTKPTLIALRYDEFNRRCMIIFITCINHINIWYLLDILFLKGNKILVVLYLILVLAFS